MTSSACLHNNSTLLVHWIHTARMFPWPKDANWGPCRRWSELWQMLSPTICGVLPYIKQLGKLSNSHSGLNHAMWMPPGRWHRILRFQILAWTFCGWERPCVHFAARYSLTSLMGQETTCTTKCSAAYNRKIKCNQERRWVWINTAAGRWRRRKTCNLRIQRWKIWLAQWRYA